MLRHGHGLRDPVIGLGQGLHPVAGQGAAGGIQDPAAARGLLLDALQDGDVAGGGAVVVADQGAAAVGVGADDPERAAGIRVQGEQAVVFQQHAGFGGGPSGQGEVRLALDGLVGDLVVFAARVAQDAQHEAGGEQAHGAAGNVFFGDQALFVSL